MGMVTCCSLRDRGSNRTSFGGGRLRQHGMWHAECIFTDWDGSESPLVCNHESVMHVRNSVFRNMNLNVEVVDVSRAGIVRFEGVLLTNVTLEHGAVVSTTANDYTTFAPVFYTASDDEGEDYDVAVVSVSLGERSVFGEEFAVDSATMSDCLYLQAQDGPVFLGCSLESPAARQRLLHTAVQAGAGAADNFTINRNLDGADGDRLLNLLLLEPDDPWISELREVRRHAVI